MTNSWSLLYEEMYGPEDEKKLMDSIHANSPYNDGWTQSLYSGGNSNYEMTDDGFLWPKDGRSLSDDRPITDTETQYSNDTTNINKPISSMSNDMISIKKTENEDGSVRFDLNLDRSPHFWKYNENKTLKEVLDYISGTYKGHYTSQESKTQTLDLIESIGDAEAFCRSNAIKYLSRFGKKDGKSKLDILKVIHYCILLYHFAGLHQKTSDNYETF